MVLQLFFFYKVSKFFPHLAPQSNVTFVIALKYKKALADCMLCSYGSPFVGSGRIWLDDLKCLGTESDIFSCAHGGVGVNNCHHNEDAGVYCV